MLVKGIKIFLEKKKTKNETIAVNTTKIFLKMRNRH